MNGDNILEVRDLRISFSTHAGEVQAVRGVTFDLRRGETLAIVGESGSGKSVTAKSIMRLNPEANTIVRGGEILFGGERVTHLPSYGRIARGIAMVPEGRRIFPNLSVRENLRTGANTIAKRQLAGQMQQVYDVFPILESRTGQRAGSLSGGEQQMLAVGRALMSRPKLLLVDELSLGLAPLVVATLTEALVKLCAEGLAVVVVDEVHVHTTTAAASRRLVLEKGRFVSESAVEAERLATVL